MWDPMQSVQSIDRAFQLLGEIADDPAGISELSRRLDLPTSTVARLLSTLEGLGAVERLDSGTGYRIGPSVVTMAASIDPTQSLLAVAQPHLVELVEMVAEAVGVSIPAGYDVHYIGQVDCANPVQVRDWTGVSLPMHVVPSGMVVLAHWPDDAVDRYLDRKLDRYTARSVIRPALIREPAAGQGGRGGLDGGGVFRGHQLGGRPIVQRRWGRGRCPAQPRSQLPVPGRHAARHYWRAGPVLCGDDLRRPRPHRLIFPFDQPEELRFQPSTA